MTNKPSRTKLYLQDLSPDSVRRVFSFINIFLNRYRLSVDYFKEQIPDFNPFEQYFICEYGRLYFNSKGSGIYLYKWLDEQYQAFDDIGEPELYDQLDQEISDNQERLLNIIPFIQKIAKERAIDLKRYNIPYKQYLNFYDDTPINSRIPLIYAKGKEKFKKVFFDIWQELYTSNQVEEIYRNSFQFTPDKNPPKVLFIEMERKMEVYTQMSYTIGEYKDCINRETEYITLQYNKNLESQSNLKKKILKIDNYEGVLRLHFAYMMYNTFPHIRDSYQNKLINDPNYSRDLYFENIIKNFSKKRK